VLLLFEGEKQTLDIECTWRRRLPSFPSCCPPYNRRCRRRWWQCTISESNRRCIRFNVTLSTDKMSTWRSPKCKNLVLLNPQNGLPQALKNSHRSIRF
jgi:hypothetical protein